MHFLYFIVPAIAAALTTRVHDASFTPDQVLRVSRQVTYIGGIPRYSTLVNDSLPGPEIRISEEKVVWIRVYNDMTDANLTMVGDQEKGLQTIQSCTKAHHGHP